MMFAVNRWAARRERLADQLDAVRDELEYVGQRIAFAGEGRRGNSAWVDALKQLADALEQQLARPWSRARRLRVEAAERVAHAVSIAGAWQVVTDLIADVVDTVDDPDEHVRGVLVGQDVWWVNGYDDWQILFNDDRDWITVRPDSVTVGATRRGWTIEPEWVEVTLRWDQLAEWSPPIAETDPADVELAAASGDVLLALVDDDDERPTCVD